MYNYITYKNILSSFIKVLQKNGIKESSELVLKDVFSIIKKTTKKSPFILFRDALEKAKPFCEIKSIRISGTNYKVPVEIKPERQKTLVFKWIILNTLKKSDLTLRINLAKEFIDTANLVSKTIKMCDDFHKTAESNKIYIQFRN
jgi:small subunit ribosomal protein S7